MHLRPYQAEAVDGCLTALSDYNSALLLMATGTGKTVVFATVGKLWHHGRILVLVHREELITQACAKVRAVCGEEPEVERGKSYATVCGNDPDAIRTYGRWVVASKDTLCGERRLRRFPRDEFSLIIVDEGHHAVRKNATYFRIVHHFALAPHGHGTAKLLLVTATPDRLDGEAMGGLCETVAHRYDIVNAVADGFLVPVYQKFASVAGLSLERLPVSRNEHGEPDVSPQALDRLMREEGPIFEVVVPTMEMANYRGRTRRALLFGTSVWQAERMAEVINRIANREHDPIAYCVHGKTEDEVRQELVAGFAAGKFQFLTGCDCFTEGFDDPGIGVVATRPTFSRLKATQMIGRALRPLDGLLDPYARATPAERRAVIRASAKPGACVVDVHGTTYQHKLVCATDVLGGHYSPPALQTVKRGGLGGPPYEITAAMEAEQARREEAARAQRKHLVMGADYTLHDVDPFDLLKIKRGPEPRALRGKPATAGQTRFLESLGLPVPRDLSFYRAKQILDEAVRLKQSQPATPAQKAYISRFADVPPNMTKAQASEIINRHKKPE